MGERRVTDCGTVDCRMSERRTAVFVSYGSTVKRNCFDSANISTGSATFSSIGILTCAVAAIREYSLKRMLPRLLKPGEVDLLATRRKRVFGGRDSKRSYGNAVNVIKRSSGFKLDDKRTVCRQLLKSTSADPP